METVRKLRSSILPGDWAVSLDLSDAYFHVPIHRRSRRYLRFAFQDKVYAFRALPFGLSLSPWVFTRVMDAVMASVRSRTSSLASNYLDDLLQKNRDRQALLLDLSVLESTLLALGFLVNAEKSDRVPSQDFTHLGMRFQTALNRVSLPEPRALKIVESVSLLLQSSSLSPRRIQTVIGLASAASDLVPRGRLRLRPLQWALSDAWSQTSMDWDCLLPLSQPFSAALLPWLNKEWLLSGVPLLPPQSKFTICADASNSGWGAHLSPQFLEISGSWTPQESKEHINVLEVKAVLRALTSWAEILRGSAVTICSDNSTVVAYLRNQGGTHSRSLNLLVALLYQLTDSFLIWVHSRHIPGRLNVLADSLSRHSQVRPSEWTLNHEVFRWVCDRLGTPLIDLFATRWNHRLPVFVSPVPDPLAYAVDALSISWDQMFAYAFPPSPLIPALLNKVSRERCRVILICPLKWSKTWINTLTNLLAAPPLPLPAREDLLFQPRSNRWHRDPQSLSLHASLLCGGTSLGSEASGLLV